ncbi:cytochrome P450 [Mycolicibacterium litorale]|uniref:Cytochrome P450 n=1 Tax=Mycolicibacterium litorale TaxID=758802 RepID=A0AAD1IQ71_9MYCO|nr:cytochrome P450 [Mycolicibacterium litorale]TDY05246.1 cytochrome P450 [Mycolicibacterium litorale]BBY18683.1 cytochrome P450 [Mycolicibacterium litorale]
MTTQDSPRASVTLLDTLDFFHNEALIDDPYPVLDRMREASPVFREPVHGVMVVTGYDEVLTVVGDPDTFSSCNSTTGPIPGFPVPLEGLDGDEVSALIDAHRGDLPFGDQLPSFDPPVHTAHRSLLSRLITPKRLKENEEFMWRLADRVLEPFVMRGGGEFIGEVAGPFALLVIADLLGVPEDDHADLTEALTGNHSLGSTDDETVMAHTPLEYLYARFTDYIAARRVTPGGDVMTEMAHATFPDGSTPEVIDVVRVAANLFSAGQETTVRLLSSALKVLAEDRALQDRLRRTPADIPNFIEEALRFESPIKGDFRLARAAATVGGVDIPAGTTLMAHYGAANRDPRQFDNPHVFDPDRPNARRHIGFGRGVHSCIGAPLARAEGRVIIQRLLERTADVTIDADAHGPAHDRHFDYVPTYILRGLSTLHVAVE